MGSSSSRETNYQTESGDYSIDNLCKCKDEEDISYFKFPSCNHNNCKRCFCKYLENFSTCWILCPQNGCKELVPDRIIRKCLSKNQLEKYDRLCCPSITRWCLISGCTGVVVEVRRGGHFECGVCEQPNCLKCKNLHNQNENCGISVNKKYEDAGAAILAKKRREKLIQFTEGNSLIINPEKSECGICKKFLLPRKGILIIPCDHNFCRVCIEGSAKAKVVLAALTCPLCDIPLKYNECKELIGEKKLINLCNKAIQYLYYHCKTPNCTAFWDVGQHKGKYTCEKCHEENCIGCHTVHKGLTCEQYKQTKQYKDILASEEFERTQNIITCFNCHYTFTKKGGCSALKCSNCWRQVCEFSGQELGPNGCKCTKRKRCNEKCTIGCIPEGKSKYEEGLKHYYYNN